MKLTGKAKELFEKWRQDKYEIVGTAEVISYHGGKGKAVIIKPFVKNGYLAVSLQIKGERRHFYIHRIFAEKYVDGYSECKEVNHKDGNKLNNHVDNLEWVTRSENTQHAYDNELIYRGNRGGDRRSKQALNKKKSC